MPRCVAGMRHPALPRQRGSVRRRASAQEPVVLFSRFAYPAPPVRAANGCASVERKVAMVCSRQRRLQRRECHGSNDCKGEVGGHILVLEAQYSVHTVRALP